MNEELYNCLIEIEDKLYDIIEENVELCELREAWCIIYNYLYSVKINYIR